MAGKLKLLEGFERGYLVHVTIAGGGSSKAPPTHHRWLIMSGSINHVTGTLTKVSVYDKAEAALLLHRLDEISFIAAATANGDYPLFNQGATELHSAFSLHFVDDDQKIVVDGDGTTQAKITVLEWGIT